MLNAQDSQFRLMEDGKIFYQSNPTNPLPGLPLAQVVKGGSILRPAVLVPESELAKDQDKGRLHTHLEGWISRHIAGVLAPLAALEKEDEDLKGPAKGIAFQVYEALGIVPRTQVGDLIAALDQDGRKALRNRQVRLGPVLIFIPALNKPAAVRLRALLWGLYNDRPLPVAAPKDGMVSFEIDPAVADMDFYRAVGYPVFGGRAIRIDMLDRVISAVYDSAKDGQFRAEHKMAEWLGCSIDGLYKVLESMGHKRIEQQETTLAPAAEAISESASESAPAVSEESASPEAVAEVQAPVEEPAVNASESETPPALAVNVKPELALFRLGRGRMSDRAAPGRPAAGRRPERDKDRDKGRDKKREEKRPHGKKEAGGKKPAGGHKRGARGDDFGAREHAVLRTGPGPKPEDSPFAILGQLRKKADE